MNEKTEIGVVIKPQGLKGELKVKIIGNNLKHLLSLNYIYLNSSESKIKILNSRAQNGFIFFQLENIDSIEKAENLRNQSLFIDKSQLPKLDSNEFFIDDLLSCVVKNQNGKEIGKICDIFNYGASDIITLETNENKSKIQFPFLDCLIDNIDVENHIVTIKEKEFNEVRLDEN